MIPRVLRAFKAMQRISFALRGNTPVNCYRLRCCHSASQLHSPSNLSEGTALSMVGATQACSFLNFSKAFRLMSSFCTGSVENRPINIVHFKVFRHTLPNIFKSHSSSDMHWTHKTFHKGCKTPSISYGCVDFTLQQA